MKLSIQPEKTTAWKFRDEPDWPRVCRELREADCTLGLVTVEKPGVDAETFTLVDYSARVWPAKTLDGLERSAGGPGEGRVFLAGDWWRFRGNSIKALLGVPTVEVRGFR